MSHIQFPYRRESTRRQHSSPDNSDFVTGTSRNSMGREQAGVEPDSTGAAAGASRGDGVGTATTPAILEALAGRRPERPAPPSAAPGRLLCRDFAEIGLRCSSGAVSPGSSGPCGGRLR